MCLFCKALIYASWDKYTGSHFPRKIFLFLTVTDVQKGRANIFFLLYLRSCRIHLTPHITNHLESDFQKKKKILQPTMNELKRKMRLGRRPREWSNSKSLVGEVFSERWTMGWEGGWVQEQGTYSSREGSPAMHVSLGWRMGNKLKTLESECDKIQWRDEGEDRWIFYSEASLYSSGCENWTLRRIVYLETTVGRKLAWVWLVNSSPQLNLGIKQFIYELEWMLGGSVSSCVLGKQENYVGVVFQVNKSGSKKLCRVKWVGKSFHLLSFLDKIHSNSALCGKEVFLTILSNKRYKFLANCIS